MDILGSCRGPYRSSLAKCTFGCIEVFWVWGFVSHRRILLSRNLLNLRSHVFKRGERKSLERGSVALRNVAFSAADFIGCAADDGARFDTVLCLSVTKWIHLHYGDKGVEQLFARVWAALKPGGHFVLEPQNFRSYRQAKRKQVRGVFASVSKLR